MKNSILILLVVLISSCGENLKIGNYTKEPLPENFTYVILKDNSNEVLEKNQLEVELSKKLTEGQIATIAEELFNSKDKQRRFYISYNIKGDLNNNIYWATSNFDPELKIEIIGSTDVEDIKTSKTDNIKGEIINKWRSEKSLMGATLILYKNDKNKQIMRINWKTGDTSEDEITESTKNGLIKYHDGNENGEYYLVQKNGNLGMYGKGGKFDEAVNLK